MNTNANTKPSGREAALARRKAMSSKGKQGSADAGRERTRIAGSQVVRKSAPETAAAPPRATNAPASPAPTPRSRGQGTYSVSSPSQQSREQAMSRREALSRAGRRAAKSTDRVRAADSGDRAAQAGTIGATGKTGCSCGCKGERSEDVRSTPQTATPVRPQQTGNGSSAKANAGQAARARRISGATSKANGRLLALARRSAQSTRGKAAGDTPTSAASLARQANPELSGRELAQKVRDQRSRNGRAGERKSESSGRIRAERRKGSADQPWKVGASETSGGQVVTGTRVGRSPKTTGDEPSTCRNVTGTEYLGADIFRDFCQAEPPIQPAKVRVSTTGHGNRVTGNEVGRSSKVTGDEPGTCKSVTGTEYLSPDQQGAICGSRPAPGPRKVGQALTQAGKAVSGSQVGRSVKVTGDEQGAGVRPTGTQYTDAQSIQNGRIESSSVSRGPVPPKVGTSVTLSGRTVTGTSVGRSAKVTGDEPGSCRVITGDEYTDRGQYEAFCNLSPKPEAPKVALSTTVKRQIISGTQTGRSARVTGDEPGTCKAVTGTPYAGLEQASEYCTTEDRRTIESRSRRLASTPGPRMTGIQPGLGGVITGAGKGACEPLTGTPYVGQDQFAAACGGNGAAPGDGDFPRPLDAGASPWEQFSVISPAREVLQTRKSQTAVTGTRYETGSQITGPFDMGVGKITGTEQFRFDTKYLPEAGLTAMEAVETAEAPAEQEPTRPRITGEGQSAGAKITGDDWERGDRVTGTEGASAKRRNPTRPGPMGAMPAPERKRNEEVPAPVSRVTGSSGSTERGALVTYSGGARG